MEALGGLGDSASIPALRQFLSRSRKPEDADIRASRRLRSCRAEDGSRPRSVARVMNDERRIRETAAHGARVAPGAATAGLAPGAAGRPDVPPRPRSPRRCRPIVGTIRIAFDATHAPHGREFRAPGALAGYFDGLAFHRVVPNFVVQDGCPAATAGAVPATRSRASTTRLPYEAGTVGMALAGKDTGGSQWFITLSPQPRLEGRYTVFGKVVLGMDVVERHHAWRPNPPRHGAVSPVER